MTVNLKRIGILSAFKVGCVMSIIPIIIIVIILLVSPIVISTSRGTSVNITGLFTIPVILYGLAVSFGVAVHFAILAILYNIAAFLVGGFELKLQRRSRKVQSEEPVVDYNRPPEYSQEFQNWDRKGKK